ncbi:protein-tyrosine sulfotransferase-like isoform X2 [Rhodamnia argentea]|uniref:Protein-tyrosine sulfotransferase-like isoform X2 n=1 Tax=Rhodamnia argentea TaxID=178133 RepID=A0ABM3HLL1_9MYRT|nr:protein-tyrosine sulfotransferase-like isoform X2 [Rhodamnia argentea]XP_048137482.1 protein-tyrosine sulfotransferase-like isoform X2 [Rhodamnia argentea]XP_048137483.1 protein-tyrosine sulfotransferase-like isoform X2 [Rhodamnia argentea]XP_048137484.1 protein-tyrosine sulfotransferase-like isoform X2 [Rhodamnia argentea]
MDPTLSLRLVILLILLGLANASPHEREFGYCEKVVKKWASSAPSLEVKENKHTLRDLLFFLHIPRTGGRTYFHCFLKKLYPSALECPRSYDKLRFDPSKPKCRLLATHDDYSMMSKLPKDKTSVVTILRHPVDRVFSTYEFSVEVAARFLVHPNLTSATRMVGRLRSKNKGFAVSTLDIWPWKYLVPWMREDLFARRDARRHSGSRDIYGSDPYNMEDVVMPLHKYINDPIARDIIHNGVTFQIAGLTNNSYFAESHEVRHCVMLHKELGELVLEVAKRRLDDMLYVGLTEDHRESATMFGDVVGAQVISQLRGSSSGVQTVATNNSEQSSLPDSEPDEEHSQNATLDFEVSMKENNEASKGNMTVGKLMESYESCISTLRKSQSLRRISSLKRVSPANFTKEETLNLQSRRQVGGAVLQEIKSLNNLDLELYEYAKDIFAQQHRRTAQNSAVTEKLENMITSSYGTSQWIRVFLFLPIMLLLIFFFLFVNARRRTSKVKI